jgi:hypothetical protein
MARHAWTILCKRTELGPEDNISLIDVVEELHIVTNAPDPENTNIFFDAGWHLVSSWERTDEGIPENIRVRVTFRGPRGPQLPPPETGLHMDANYLVARSDATIGRLLLRGSGRYEFLVEHKTLPDGAWEESCRVPLHVDMKTNPDLPPPEPPTVMERSKR